MQDLRAGSTQQVLSGAKKIDSRKPRDTTEDAWKTKGYARAIQKERRSLSKAMFASREKSLNAKVINRDLDFFIDNQAYDDINLSL